ncbi:hypothetical protein MM326_06860 [Alkalihalobacillus sp. LMS6]|uniref:hypothetical protein n=1 Tax=Bacillaceae TaxID=186817 RepID=UPI000C082A62|nr:MULTISPECIES: hypothetical protein [Bacillaceae]UTR07728.1 hypothetical protein MM326_06860 [Alkalihalobacillus sp. LMS6]
MKMKNPFVYGLLYALGPTCALILLFLIFDDITTGWPLVVAIAAATFLAATMRAIYKRDKSKEDSS